MTLSIENTMLKQGSIKTVIVDAHTANPGDESWDAFHVLGPMDVYDHTPPQLLAERCAGAPIVITNKAVFDRALIEKLPDLRYIGVIATGYNVVDLAATRERGIVVTNVPNYCTKSVAQFVFALLLELARRVAHHDQTVRDGQWSRCRDFCYWNFPQIELTGRTMGLIGCGHIGQAVAHIAKAFGMRVLAHARSAKDLPGIEFVPLGRLLGESDVVSLHCPLTDQTRHIINAQSLAQMKPTAFLINTSRGPLIDEPALAAALNERQIAGAALDVLSVEPPEADNPLLSAPNCFITPHIAWASVEARATLIDLTYRNVAAFLEGRPINVVNGL